MSITPTDRYQKANISRYVIKVNHKLEPELAKYLDSLDNRQGYILGLVRADMAAQAAEEEPADES